MSEATQPTSIKLAAPAKVNLFLEVLGRRDDGYHDIESVFQAISLYDDVTVTLGRGGGTSITCNMPELANGGNLACLAAEEYRRATGCAGGIEIELLKRIPLQAGLGGGSSDAAAVLVGLNSLTGGKMTADELRSLGARVGSDVPFFIEGGTALVEGRGERVTTINSPEEYSFVLLTPGFGVSTAEVYKKLRLKLTEKRHDANVVATAISHGNLQVARKSFFNRLERAAFNLERRLKEAAASMQGCLGGAPVMLCGSGSSLFSAFVERGKAVAGYKALREKEVGTVFLADGIRGKGCAADPKGDCRGDIRCES